MYIEINEINILVIFLVCQPGLGKLFRFSRVNGDAVDVNQKRHGVRIYSGVSWVIFLSLCSVIFEKIRKNGQFRIFAYGYGIICILP